MKKAKTLPALFLLVAFASSTLAMALPPIHRGALQNATSRTSTPALATSSTLPSETPPCTFQAAQSENRLFLPLIQRAAGQAGVQAGATPSLENRLPPEPATIAPVVAPESGSDFIAMTDFLYKGEHSLQRGVAVGTIDPQRVSVLRGRTCTRAGTPLSGVTVSILDHPEYGSTLTRADGMFDLSVIGGGLLTVTYNKDGYLPIQRQIIPPWQDFAWLPEVALIPLDTKVTTINLTSSDPFQVVQGSPVSDQDGSRQATLLVPKGTQAEMLLPSGVTQILTTLNVRATEYTVGPGGPAAMPAELPPTSGYTYALEYSVDDAQALGALDVQFSQPLYHYVENFLNFPVGMTVPVGYYDRQKAVWVPSQNGRVVKILSISGGLAVLDIDGDGVGDNGAILGITDAERQRLASLYNPGQSLWRVPITHFTPWDCNWNKGPGPEDGPPNQDKPKGDNRCDNGSCSNGSTIEIQNQILGEAVDVAGTPFSLHYASDRVPGRIASYTLDIPLSGNNPPATLKRIALEVSVAGQRLALQFPASPNQSYRYTWDGKSAYGQVLQGAQPIDIKIGYVYTAVYMEPADFEKSFALLSGVPITGNYARDEVTLWQEWKLTIGGWDNRPQGLGGWSLDVLHAYDPKARVLYLGDGNRLSADSLGAGVIRTVAGGGWVPGADIGDGGQATQAELYNPERVAVAPDGSFYIADYNNQRVRRVDPSGIITTVAGTGVAGFGGDGGPAVSAILSGPTDVAYGTDGSLYIADRDNQRIRKVDPNGIITTIAGTGVYGYNGDGIPAVSAKLNDPYGVAVGPDGSLYVADKDNQRIRRIGLDGIITTVAGNGLWGYTGDGGPSVLARLGTPWAIAIGEDGSLYIAEYSNSVVRRVTPDGIISTIAGIGTPGYSGDGGLATLAQLSQPEGVAVGPEGSVYIVDYGNERIRRVDADGGISTIAGTGKAGFSGDGGLAVRAQIDLPRGVGTGPDGSVYIVDGYNQRIRRVAPVLPGGSAGELFIPSEDGDQIYVFSGSGRHLRTLNALTGAVIFQFAYDSAFRLTSVTDGDGNVTSIERDSSGLPVSIVSPYGQHTAFSTNANGYLTSITDPAGGSVQLTYTSGGLMTSLRDQRGNIFSFTYDAAGRLTRDSDPAGGFQTLSRSDASGAYTVTLSTAMGETFAYQIKDEPGGGQIRLDTLPGGEHSEQIENPDGSILGVSPQGMQSSFVPGPDPRWGMLAPLAETLVFSTPAGLAAHLAFNSSAILADANDPLSLVSLTDQASLNGQVVTRLYDAATQTFTLTSPIGRQTSVKIDPYGRVVAKQSGSLLPMNYTYDNRGRLVTLTVGTRTTSLTYNSAGYLATLIDPLGRQTSFAYDATGRLTQEILPGGQIIQYAYDASGNLTSLTPPGRTAHKFTYTPVNLLASYSPPELPSGTSQTVYQYNLDRQVTTITRPDGLTMDYAYDSAGRLSTLTTPRGSLNYTYDPGTGSLASISAPGGIGLSFSYDGALLNTETWSGPVAGSVGYTYNQNFLVSAQTLNGANPVAFAYDSDGLLTQAGSLALTLDAQNGSLSASALGSLTDAWSYNEFGEVTGYNAAFNSSPLYDVAYTRDALGRIIQKTETIAGAAHTFNFYYDSNGHLVGVMRDGTSIASYTYDANGNRLTFTSTGGTVNSLYDNQDRLTQSGATTYTYSAGGELQSKTKAGQTTTYTYDALGNLMSVIMPGGKAIAYLVDGQNRRIGKKVNGALVQGFLYEGKLRPVAELNGSGYVLSRFVYASHENVPDYMIRGGATYRILTDNVGSPRLVVNAATGVVVQQMDYDAFGNVLLDTNPGFQPFGFAGGLYDRDTGLVHFGARDYDSETGRWTAKDPVLFDAQQTNLYIYVSNDPVNLHDSLGLWYGPADEDKLFPKKPSKPAPKPKKRPCKKGNKSLEDFFKEHPLYELAK